METNRSKIGYGKLTDVVDKFARACVGLSYT